MTRINKEERNKYEREWYFKNKNRIAERKRKSSRLYISKNRQKTVENARKYYKNNKEKRMKKIIEYTNKKLKTDINWILKKRLRGRLWQALKGKNKSKRTMELLGVPHIDFLKTWLECKFKEGMTWENRHLWHIDHVLPCSSFDLTKPEEQAKCFHYTNLQPLWAGENLSKGNRIS